MYMSSVNKSKSEAPSSNAVMSLKAAIDKTIIKHQSLLTKTQQDNHSTVSGDLIYILSTMDRRNETIQVENTKTIENLTEQMIALNDSVKRVYSDMDNLNLKLLELRNNDIRDSNQHSSEMWREVESIIHRLKFMEAKSGNFREEP